MKLLDMIKSTNLIEKKLVFCAQKLDLQRERERGREGERMEYDKLSLLVSTISLNMQLNA